MLSIFGTPIFGGSRPVNDEIEALRAENARLKAEFAELTTRLAATQADAILLDWFDAQWRDASIHSPNGTFKPVKAWAIATQDGVSLRIALNAARTHDLMSKES